MIEEIIKRYSENDSFIVISASAGTGKTHIITKRELEHLFDKRSLNFLSITFTNQAAREMKERLVNYLIEISLLRDTKEMKREDLLDLCKSLRIASTQMAERLLFLLLQQYSALNISTIDSLAVRLLRAYQDQTGMVVEPKILLNEGDFYNELITNFLHSGLLAELSESKAVYWSKNILRQMSGNELKMDPIGAITYEVQSIREYMLNNEVDLGSIATTLNVNIIDSIAKRIREIYANILKLDKINCGYINQSTIKSIVREIDSERPKIVNIRVNKEGKKDSEFLSEIQRIEKELKEIVEKQKYYLLCMAEEYIDIAAFLNRFQKVIEKEVRNQSEIPLSEIYPLLTNSIADPQGVSLRMGTKFGLVLVDEFQDTSLLQLSLLSNIFNNVLQNSGNIIVVGDTKQGIYGFRNADYRIMSDIIANKIKGVEKLGVNFRSAENIVKFIGNLFPKKDNIKQYVSTLDFKDDNSNTIDGEIYYEAFQKTGLYDQHNIKAFKKDSGGYIEIRTYGIDLLKIREMLLGNSIDSEEIFSPIKPEFLFEDIYEIIQDATNRGYSFKDIAVLLRSNEEVRSLGAYLSKPYKLEGERISYLKNVPFKSFSSTDARERPVSKEIISIVKAIYNHRDTLSFNVFLRGELFYNRVIKDHLLSENNYRALIDSFCRPNVITDVSSKNGISKDLQQVTNFAMVETIKKNYPEVYEACFKDLFDRGIYLSAYELLLNIYSIFKVPYFYNEEQAAYMRLLDAAIQIEKEEDSSIATYIQRFEEQTYEEFESESMWTMDVPESVDAVTISTVHKMKGREFPIIIYTYKRQVEKRRSQYVVCPIGGKNYLIKPESRLLKEQNCDYPEIKLIQKKIKENFVQYAANTINAHYVALTRAKEELYILLYNNRKKEGTKCILTSMLYNFLVNNTMGTTREKDKKCDIYKIGKKRQGKIEGTPFESPKPLTIEIPLQRVEYARSYLLSDEMTDYGVQIHSVLEQIEYCDGKGVDTCVSNAIERAKRSGVAIHNPVDVKEDTRRVLSNSKMNWAFEKRDGRTVLREKEFVDENGSLMRMDRVVIDPEEVCVIDYKSGHPYSDEIEAYKRQVSMYMELLSKYYNKKVCGYIFLISKDEVIKL